MRVLEFGFGDVISKGLKFLIATKGNNKRGVLAFQRSHSKLIGITDLGRIQSKNLLFKSTLPLSFYGTIFHELMHVFDDYFLRTDPESLEFLQNNVDNLFKKDGNKWLFKDKGYFFLEKNSFCG